MDRLDYMSMMCNVHAYVLAIERLLGIEAPDRAQYIRTLFDEVTRILNHLLWIGSNGLDLGAMALFLYAFREREELMDCYEAVRSEEHTSELQSLMRISYAVFCLKKKKDSEKHQEISTTD